MPSEISASRRIALDRRLNVGQECVATVETLLLPTLDPDQRNSLLERTLALLRPR